ncbi:hypothetical protein [Clostridium sp.]|uniref:hypothetical protein n=1 Tax=Clostridium sp. TaxID=1506 RepID=UPI0032175CC8
METYFKFKFFMEMLIITILVSIGILSILIGLFNMFMAYKKEKYMSSIGYSKFLKGVSSVGGKAYYAYKKDGNIVNENNIDNMKLKDVKRKYK